MPDKKDYFDRIANVCIYFYYNNKNNYTNRNCFLHQPSNWFRIFIDNFMFKIFTVFKVFQLQLFILQL